MFWRSVRPRWRPWLIGMVVLAIIVRAFTVWMRYQDEAPLRDLQQAVRTGEDYTLRIAVTPEEAEDLIENFTLRDDPQREQLRSVDYDQNMALFIHSSRGEFAGPVLADLEVDRSGAEITVTARLANTSEEALENLRPSGWRPSYVLVVPKDGLRGQRIAVDLVIDGVSDGPSFARIE
jgi:hypothetical protein